ncbi:hypothetical protein HMSSN036_87390 [Paenibacillus macerans]|nr:hypothetical protein HMSSN036_87390 [Paenibacillus macerans]
MKILKNVADMLRPETVPGRFRHLLELPFKHLYLAFVGTHQAADDMQQRAFARSTRPGNRQLLPLAHLPLGNIQNRNVSPGNLKLFSQTANVQHECSLPPLIR